eukprot:5736298-Prymnesium_polylepis.1
MPVPRPPSAARCDALLSKLADCDNRREALERALLALDGALPGSSIGGAAVLAKRVEAALSGRGVSAADAAPPTDGLQAMCRHVRLLRAGASDQVRGATAGWTRCAALCSKLTDNDEICETLERALRILGMGPGLRTVNAKAYPAALAKSVDAALCEHAIPAADAVPPDEGAHAMWTHLSQLKERTVGQLLNATADLARCATLCSKLTPKDDARHALEQAHDALCRGGTRTAPDSLHPSGQGLRKLAEDVESALIERGITAANTEPPMNGMQAMQTHVSLVQDGAATPAPVVVISLERCEALHSKLSAKDLRKALESALLALDGSADAASLAGQAVQQLSRRVETALFERGISAADAIPPAEGVQAMRKHVRLLVERAGRNSSEAASGLVRCRALCSKLLATDDLREALASAVLLLGRRRSGAVGDAEAGDAEAASLAGQA